MSQTIRFCATGKSGLGHLRRITNIAAAVGARRRAGPLELFTNAAAAGLTAGETALYQRIEVAPCCQMAHRLATRTHHPVVVDTAVLPDLAQVDAPLCLILRETVESQIPAFNLAGGRPWDLVVLPNPTAEWRPRPGALAARRVEAVGWIYRRPSNAARTSTADDGKPHEILIASGGGGSGATAAVFRANVAYILQDVRAALNGRLHVAHAVGPRAPGHTRIAGVDRSIDAGARLHEVFVDVDLVISTVGYNSVLELACTDVPVLLVPIARTFDDQVQRARRWGPRLGLDHRPDYARRSVAWIVDTLVNRRRRAPVDIGPSGAARCATLLEALLA